MVISPIDFEVKKTTRKFSWRKGMLGQLKERHFGANDPSGKCKLVINGVVLDELNFKNKSERDDIFKFWKRRYLRSMDEFFIELSYETINLKDRSLKYIR